MEPLSQLLIQFLLVVGVLLLGAAMLGSWEKSQDDHARDYNRAMAYLKEHGHMEGDTDSECEVCGRERGEGWA